MTVHKKRGSPITVNSSQCTGCLICEMRCSFRFERAFNPPRAAIKVLRTSNNKFKTLFTDECDNCGICARFCPYGALIQERQK